MWTTASIRHVHRLRRQRGATLVDVALALSVIAIVTIGVFTYFQSANTGAKINESIQQLASVQQAVRSRYASSPDYTGLSTSLISKSDKLGASMVSGETIRHAFNGPVTIAPADVNGLSNAAFRVEFAGLPSEACIELAMMDVGSSLVRIEVDGTGGSRSLNRALRPDEATAACGDDDGSRIAWTFY